MRSVTKGSGINTGPFFIVSAPCNEAFTNENVKNFQIFFEEFNWIFG